MKALVIALLLAGCSSPDACDRLGTRIASGLAANAGTSATAKEAAADLGDRVSTAIAGRCRVDHWSDDARACEDAACIMRVLDADHRKTLLSAIDRARSEYMSSVHDRR